jgi:hypothetical protein
MSNEINLSTSVKYHQFKFSKNKEMVKFLTDLGLKEDSDFYYDEGVITLLDGENEDHRILKEDEYIFFIDSVLAFWFDNFGINILTKEYAETIIPRLKDHEKIQLLEIQSKYKINCPLSISGNCKALEGK